MRGGIDRAWEGRGSVVSGSYFVFEIYVIILCFIFLVVFRVEFW